MYVGTVLRFISRAVCVCLASLVNIAWELIGSLAGPVAKGDKFKIGYGKKQKDFFKFPFQPCNYELVVMSEISDVDRDGKNLHQGQAIGNDLLTDTEKECTSLLIFFNFHNTHYI